MIGDLDVADRHIFANRTARQPINCQPTIGTHGWDQGSPKSANKTAPDIIDTITSKLANNPASLTTLGGET